MKIENTGIDGAIIDIKPLDRLMGRNAFVLGGHWDYEHVTYDYKINSDEKNITYYIRIQGVATEGDVDSGDAVIELRGPFLGKHYYPHGVEYGEEENFPKEVVDLANNLLKRVNEEIVEYKRA